MSEGGILVVEDNSMITRLLTLLLEASGYRVWNATTGAEALRWLRNHENKKPAAIIMDIQIPIIDGLTLTRKIKSWEGWKEIPIIAVTAYAMEGDRERALDAGCDAYVPKPIDTREFMKILKKITGVPSEN